MYFVKYIDNSALLKTRIEQKIFGIKGILLRRLKIKEVFDPVPVSYQIHKQKPQK